MEHTVALYSRLGLRLMLDSAPMIAGRSLKQKVGSLANWLTFRLVVDASVERCHVP
jgi:hypothetical protein